MPRITIDGSQAGRGTQLATCPECVAWRELRGTRAAALMAGADHASMVHGDHHQASQLRQRARDLVPDTPS
jgi:hypothetical protein